MLILFAHRLRHANPSPRLPSSTPFRLLNSAAPIQRTHHEHKDPGTTELSWDTRYRTFIPRRGARQRQVAEWPPATNPRLLLDKILGASGYYSMVRNDLMSIYHVSYRDALSATRQLERLLFGLSSRREATARLLDYLAWKRDFFPLLKPSPHAGLDSDDHPMLIRPKPNGMPLQPIYRHKWGQIQSQLESFVWGESSDLLNSLSVTWDPSQCPGYVLEDVVYLLYRRYEIAASNGNEDDAKRKHQEVVALSLSVLAKCPSRYLGFEQVVLRSLCVNRSTLELTRLFELLKAKEHPVQANTLLHFASLFAIDPDTKPESVAILHSLATQMPGFDINSPAPSSVCTSLLTLAKNAPVPSDDVAPDVLFAELLKCGLQPNLLNLTALMRNFCVRGRLDTAWKVLDMILRHGLEPDPHVYSILLNGSKMLMDTASTDQIVGIIQSRNAWSTVLVNDLLDILYRDNEWQPERRRRQRKKKNNAWRPMFALYAKFYRLEPLQRLTRFPLENLSGTWAVKPEFETPITRIADALEPQPGSKLIRPDSNTLCLMLAAHMRSIKSYKPLVAYHAYFWKLVKNGDSIATGVLSKEGTRVFDIFLRSLMQFKQTIGLAVCHVQKLIALADDEFARHGQHILYHPPSAHTWSILINGLKNHGNMRSAVSVIDTMRKHTHTKPTLATWNALIQGLAREGNVAGAIRAMGALERAGYQPNERTMKAFSLMPRHLRDKAIVMLEKRRKAADATHEVSQPSPDTTSSQERLSPIVMGRLDEIAERHGARIQRPAPVQRMDGRPQPVSDQAPERPRILRVAGELNSPQLLDHQTMHRKRRHRTRHILDTIA